MTTTAAEDDQVWDDIRGLNDHDYAAKYRMCGGCGKAVADCCGGCKDPICPACPDRIAEGWFVGASSARP